MKKSKLKIVVPHADAPKRFTVSLGSLLAISFGILVALSIAVVLAISVRTNFVNTFSLLNDRAIVLFDSMERRIKAEAHQAERTVSTIARLYTQGKIGIEDTPEEHAVLETLLLSMPAVEGVFLFGDGKLSDALFRRPEGVVGPLPPAFAQADLAQLFSKQIAETADKSTWHDPVVAGKTMFHAVSHRLVRNGGTTGVVIALIGRNSISRVMVKLGEENSATVFLLGTNNAVIAHSGLPDVFKDRVAIPLDAFPDETLRRIASAVPARENFEVANRHGIQVRVTEGRDDGYMFLTKELSEYAASPFTLGIYYPKADVGEEVLRAILSLAAGLLALLVAVVAAVLLGRSLSRPMRQIAGTAALLSSFDIDEIRPLPRSRVREVDEQAVALNRMHTMLRQFARYVPRELVARLMRSGADAVRPVEREMTIMFTDIVGFTSLSENMSAAEVTSLLNQHFATITRHVEETQGAIDKFLGDGVMAFWGAPEADGKHVAHAVAAAQAIAKSVRADNAIRRERGEAVLRLRIGIHTGRVVVGNIGGDDRQNYTIVGDAVNVAQRIEQMARDAMGENDETVVLTSTDVSKAAGDVASFIPVGTRVVRGRQRPIGVCILPTGDTAQDGNVVPFAGSSPA
ncbi:MAG: adenylate/guanylate cyclase domain-containing protein [Nitratireductor sp.]|nr:adenylate/guanylate cyclase domain-containing protein [Nitratireductor sp.]